MPPRRHILTALAALPLTAAAPPTEAPAPAKGITDLVLSCDAALGPAVRRAARLFRARAGVQVRVFPTGPGLLVPQLARAVQNDLLMTRRSIMETASAAGLLAGPARGAWRNPLVLAARRGAGPGALTGRLAVADPTPLSDMDGPGIAARLGLAPATLIGVIDTGTVRALLERGEAEAGLLHASDVAGHADLDIVEIVPEATAPALTYMIAVTILARRPRPEAFVDFLISSEGSAVLTTSGLERVA